MSTEYSFGMPSTNNNHINYGLFFKELASIWELKIDVHISYMDFVHAVMQGSLSLAITAKDGVVLAAEQRIASPLLIPPTKLQKVSKVLASVSSGLSSDARYLTTKARILAQVRRNITNDRLRVTSRPRPYAFYCFCTVLFWSRNIGLISGKKWDWRD